MDVIAVTFDVAFSRPRLAAPAGAHFQKIPQRPSHYCLQLSLQRARQLLIDTNNSIVQVGLMCGFSSGSHFSTAFGALFGNTPREERQRRLAE